MVVHTCNASTLGGGHRRFRSSRSFAILRKFEASLGYMRSLTGEGAKGILVARDEDRQTGRTQMFEFTPVHVTLSN